MSTGRAGTRGLPHRAIGLICLAAAGSLGCKGTIQRAAAGAAPAAVEGAVEEAQQPDTRDDVARILADEDIHSASGALTAAIVSGALDGLTDEARVKQLRALADAMVQSMGASMSRSLRDDIGPQLSEALAQAVDRSIERALDADTEQRLEAMTVAVTRGMLKGVSESLLDENGQPSPVWAAALGRIARGVTEQAAFGLDDAIRRAEQIDGAQPDDGAPLPDRAALDERVEPPARALAALGTLSSFTQALPFLILGGMLVFLCLCAVPVGWLLWRLRHHKRENIAHREAALALARAIKSTESQAWSSELREHLARETQGSAGSAELQRMLREHAELRLRPRRDASPVSERSHDAE
jgi:hypothetical protein